MAPKGIVASRPSSKDHNNRTMPPESPSSSLHRRRRTTTRLMGNGRKSGTDASRRSPLEEYIPPYLRRFVYPHHGDFCITRAYHPRIMAQLMAEGFLPIAAPDVLLPKLHAQRCVIPLPTWWGGTATITNPVPSSLHISKSTRKKSKRFALTINQAFDQVIVGCHEQHGEKCWLYPPLVKVFEAMHAVEHVPAVIMNDDLTTSIGSGDSIKKAQVCPVRLYSVEVWNVETGALAGGELGYTVGSIYTSLTGFSREDSAGSVQLAALGKVLQQRGFTLWDLGMEMDYKVSLGCQLLPRADFVQHVHAVRRSRGYMTLPEISMSAPLNCKTILDQVQVEGLQAIPCNVDTSVSRAPTMTTTSTTGTATTSGRVPIPPPTKRLKKALSAPTIPTIASSMTRRISMDEDDDGSEGEEKKSEDMMCISPASSP